MAVSATLGVTLSGTQTSALDLGTASFPLAIAKRLTFTDGTGEDQCDREWSDTRTLAASATENLDLAAVLTDAFGATLTFAKIKAIVVTADDGNTNNVVIGGHASAAFVGPFGDATDTISIKPGGVFVIACPGTGYAVTATTADLIKVLNSGGTTGVTYSIAILGTSV